MEGFLSAHGWRVHPGVAHTAAGVEAAGHMASVNRKQRDVNAATHCPFPRSLLSGTPAWGRETPIFRAGLPRSVTDRPRCDSWVGLIMNLQRTLTLLCDSSEHPFWGSGL